MDMKLGLTHSGKNIEGIWELGDENIYTWHGESGWRL